MNKSSALPILILLIAIGGLTFMLTNTKNDLPPEPGTHKPPFGSAIKIYQGFGVPYDVFENNKDIMTLDKDSFILHPQESSLPVKISASQKGGYVYKYGYYSTKTGWVKYQFPQAAVQDSNWISESAAIDLQINRNDITEGENYFISYSCKKYNGAWACGCTTTSGPCSQWMLQTYTYSSGECSPGSADSRICGNCGTQARACQSDFKWSSFSQCSNQKECSPGSAQESNCGVAGKQTRICSSACSWSAYGQCEGDIPSEPPAPPNV